MLAKTLHAFIGYIWATPSLLGFFQENIGHHLFPRGMTINSIDHTNLASSFSCVSTKKYDLSDRWCVFDFLGGGGGGGGAHFDLIVSYLIILNQICKITNIMVSDLAMQA
jgi:hypothetical protein